MRLVVALAVCLSSLGPLVGCRSSDRGAARGENLAGPLGLEEVRIVSKGLE